MLRASLLPWGIRETLQRRRVTIILYHAPEPSLFAGHVRALSKRYSIVALRTVIDVFQGYSGRKLPPKPLVITFDDGHRRNHELIPTLARLPAPPTIFLCSGIVGTGRRFWFKHVSDREALKQLPDEERRRRLKERGFDETGESREREALSDAEIIEMARLVDFQSHTVTHPILPSCSADTARREIAQSKHDLERQYGLDIYAFSYPNGDYSDRDAEIAKQSGYACAITVDAGFNTRRTDRFRLKRIIVEDDDSTDVLIVRTSGLWAALARVVRRKPYGRKPVQEEDS
jgi:poly-beta-1,6-N-acetyl-D-glucosamine N-deacetylase